MNLPAFSLAWSPYGTVMLNWPSDVPHLLRVDMVEVIQPLVKLAASTADELLEVIHNFLTAWLRDRVSDGDLYFDNLRNCWRYGL